MSQLNKMDVPIFVIYGNHDIDCEGKVEIEPILKNFKNVSILNESKKYSFNLKNKTLNVYNWAYHLKQTNMYTPIYDDTIKDDQNNINISILHDTFNFISFSNNDDNNEKINIADIKTKYTFAGHIHSYINYKENNQNFVYTSSAITNNFKEGMFYNNDNNVNHGYVVFEPFKEKKIIFRPVEQQMKFATFDSNNAGMINTWLSNYDVNDTFYIKLKDVDFSSNEPLDINYKNINFVFDNVHKEINQDVLKMFEEERQKVENVIKNNEKFNIDFLELEINNYKKIKQLYFNFEINENFIQILGGNMSGKSSVLEAIIYTLTGSTHIRANNQRKNKNLQNTLNKFSKNGFVRLKLKVNDKVLILKRIINSNKEKLEVSNESLYQSVKKYFNLEIRDYILLSCDNVHEILFGTFKKLLHVNYKTHLYTMRSKTYSIKKNTIDTQVDFNTQLGLLSNELQVLQLKKQIFEMKMQCKLSLQIQIYQNNINKLRNELVIHNLRKRNANNLEDADDHGNYNNKNVALHSFETLILKDVNDCMTIQEKALLNEYNNKIQITKNKIENLYNERLKETFKTQKKIKVFEIYNNYLKEFIENETQNAIKSINKEVKNALGSDYDWEIVIMDNELYLHENNTSTVFTHLSGYQRIKTLVLLLYVFKNTHPCKMNFLMFDEVLQCVSIENHDEIVQLLDTLFPTTKKIIIDHNVNFTLMNNNFSFVEI